MTKSKLKQEVLDLFWLLANPQRLRMFELLGTGEAQTIDELSQEVGINTSSISMALRHFRTFRFLTELDQEGRLYYYGLDKERIVAALYALVAAAELELTPRSKTKKKSAKKKKK